MYAIKQNIRRKEISSKKKKRNRNRNGNKKIFVSQVGLAIDVS
jgi:hypothetical protein